MGTISEKLTYLDETREKIRQSINSIGGSITNSDTFRSYSDAIDEIYEKLPKVEGTGSNITLENTTKGKMTSELEGNTTQSGTPTPDSPQPVNVVSGEQEVVVCGKNLLPYKNQDFTINNVRYYCNNGNLYLDGTSTGETSRTNQTFKDNFAFYLDAGTYTLKQNILDSGNANYFVKYISKYDDNTSLAYINNTASQATFTLTERTHVYLGFYVYQKTFDNETFNIQLEKGQATTYEEYKGQSYEINLGKNLFDTTKNTLTPSGLTITPNSDGSLTITGTTTGGLNASMVDSTNLPKLEAGTYTRSIKVVGTITKNGKNVILTGRDSNNANIMGDLAINENATRSRTSILTETHTMSGINLYVDGAGVVFDCTIYIQIEKGSQATNWVQYKTPIELCKINDYKDRIFKGSGVNLLPNNNTTQTINGITFTKNDNGSITLSGTSNAIADYYLVGNASEYVDLGLSTGTYNLNGVSGGALNTYMLYAVVNRNGTLSYYQSTNATGLNISIQSGDTFRIFIRVLSNQTPNITIYPQLNEGTTALPYEPYNSKGKWYLHKEIGKLNVDTSQITLKSNYSDIEYATIPKPNNFIGYGSFDKVEIICKSASYIAQAPSGWNDANLVNKISGNPEINRWWLGFSKGTGITAIQNALNGSYIYYPLTTPTTEEITDSELIEQLAEFGDAKSYEGTTNINVDGDLPTILNVKALEDIFSQ